MMMSQRFVLLLAAAAIASTTPAAAVVFTVTPSFSGQIGVGFGSRDPLGQPPFDVKNVVTDASGTHFSQVAAVLETGPGGTFLFQNSHVGTGSSFGSAATLLLVQVTNNSDIPQDFRLDSQITPGHIAARDAGGSSKGSSGGFDFSIQQDTGCVECTFPKLFDMFATIRPNGLGFTASRNFYGLNGLHRTRTGNALAYDWGATNIAIDLGTFQSGEIRNYIYNLTTSSNIFGRTEGVFANRCDSVQVSFGDPKTRGGNGGGNLAVPFDSKPRPLPLPDPTGCDIPRVNPLIGLPFGPYQLPLTVVPETDPLPGQPPVPSPINYSVPEPGALALFGLATLALAARRRRA